jgi:membrane-associated phospholipid phosphatase
VVTLVVLYHFDPARYVRWRNTLLLMLVVVLIGFWFYPLMPPRLLPSSFGFVDTRLTYFTIGESVPHSQEVGNLFAAMPSLHIAWSTWTAFALWPLVRPRWGRVLLASYPVLMTFATVVTANHYVFDAVGGWAAVAIGYALASWRDWWPCVPQLLQHRRPHGPELPGGDPAFSAKDWRTAAWTDAQIDAEASATKTVRG